MYYVEVEALIKEDVVVAVAVAQLDQVNGTHLGSDEEVC